jgi:hypothetical protein
MACYGGTFTFFTYGSNRIGIFKYAAHKKMEIEPVSKMMFYIRKFDDGQIPRVFALSFIVAMFLRLLGSTCQSGT